MIKLDSLELELKTLKLGLLDLKILKTWFTWTKNLICLNSKL